ncbi:KAP family P-loop domain-containing protein [Maribacter aquivivus]|uniref:KAP family P-loop domain-containing protein n=1 Tax=Maribacter aquivivus TaxID=228958 RepID=A0A1M6QQE8_9FLAO|nr:P-loop NTPase fold protein [Maribacter aquivivus]SHK22481.1 KAP family P-loop domain-containing protein [Maribacter aquivivus]
MNKNYPIFLSRIAKGEDKIEGGSQNNLAEVISEIIKEDKLEKKVIGLEGDWGSGKSNLIRIIQSRLGENYHTFIFDAWGSQEDLTRKSFLEQLINELFIEEFLTEKEKWKDLKNRLLSNTSTTHTQKFPQIKSYWLVISLSLLLYAFLSSTYEHIIKNFDFVESVFFGYFKPLIWIYLIPVGFFIWGLKLSKKEYLKERENNSKKDIIDQDSRWVTIGKLFYWYNGKEINSEEVKNIIEDEPSVKQFREYFKNIEDEIKGKGKLILVFDNLDRLDNDKIKSLWSSIHTFFAEDNNSFNSWVIVPYDKAKLQEHLENGLHGFIGKTFSLNFRITPPVVTQWEQFLNQMLDDAFGKELLNQEEIEYVTKLFDILASNKTIKPRQIINYTNDLVSMYKLWRKDIEDNSIKFRYIALFTLVKDSIINTPNESILNRDYLKGAAVFFKDDEDLDTSMSMLTFGVKKDLADEVLLDRQLKIALREGNEEIIKSSLKHRAFQKYFFQANSAIQLSEKLKGLVKIYKVVNEIFSANMMNTFWEDFGKEIKLFESEFEVLNDNHKAILKNTEKGTGKSILLKLIKGLKKDFDSLTNQEKYLTQIILIEEFINEENIDIDFFSLITKINFSAEPYMKFVNKVKSNYKKYKILCSQKELTEWFFGENEELDINKIFSNLTELETVKDEYEMDSIIIDISAKIKTISHNDKENLIQYVKILKVLAERPVKLKLSIQFYDQLTSAKLDSDEIYEDAYCIGISDFQVSHANSSNFQSSLRSLTEEQLEKISSKIESYMSYQELLELLTTNTSAIGFLKLKNVAHKVTINDYGESSLNIMWALKKFDNIATKVFDDDKEKVKSFVEKLSSWHMLYNGEVESISEGFFKHFNLGELKLVELIIKNTLKHYKGLSKEQIMESFKTKNKDFKILNALIDNDLIDKFSNAFYSAYDDYMKEIASEKEAVPEVGIWDTLIDKLHGNKLKSTFTNIRDIFINERGELKEGELYFFKKGLINYANLSTNPERSTLKIIIPLIESDSNFEIFLDNKDSLIPIIQSSKQHSETAIGELQLRYNSKNYLDDERMKDLATTLSLKKEDISKDDDAKLEEGK